MVTLGNQHAINGMAATPATVKRTAPLPLIRPQPTHQKGKLMKIGELHDFSSTPLR
jgi:hypothetical protein